MTEPQENSAALRQLTFENAAAIDALQQTVSDAATRFGVPPASAQAESEERLAKIEQSLSETAESLRLSNSLAERNTRDIAALQARAGASQSRLERAEELIKENARLLKIAVDENRAARAKWQARI